MRAYELHISGNGGVKVRVTDLLCKVKTAAKLKSGGHRPASHGNRGHG
jgi:NAD(P)H-nitrite reductase large subunit